MMNYSSTHQIIRSSLLSLVFFLLVIPFLPAQTFFSTFSQGQLSLTEQSALQKVLSRPNNGYSIVQVANLATSQNKGKLSFVLPGFLAPTLAASVVYAEYTDDNNYIWEGTLDDGSGDVTLIARDGGRIGIINQGTTSYFLHPLGGNRCALTKEPSTESRTAECENINSAVESSLEWCEDDDNDCAATIDVLLLFTAPATTWLNQNYGSFSPLYVLLGLEVMNVA